MGPNTDTAPKCGFCTNACGNRDPHRECADCQTWDSVFWRHVRKGMDRSDAALRADEWENRRSAKQKDITNAD